MSHKSNGNGTEEAWISENDQNDVFYRSKVKT